MMKNILIGLGMFLAGVALIIGGIALIHFNPDNGGMLAFVGCMLISFGAIGVILGIVKFMDES